MILASVLDEVKNVITVTDIGLYVQITTNIFVIISVVFVGYQAYMYKTDYKTKNDKMEVEKAIQLAEFYANHIIERVPHIIGVYKQIGIEDIIVEIDSTKMIEFDKEELDTLIPEKKQKEIKEKLADIKVEYIISGRGRQKVDQGNYYEDSIDNLARMKEINGFKKDNPELYKFCVRILNSEFNLMKTDILNKLEFFSMYFNSEVADEGTVYQSLHQTFLKAVKLFYYEIAVRNNKGCDKYYTNIIQLYNTWNRVYTETNRTEINVNRKQVKKGKKVKGV